MFIQDRLFDRKVDLEDLNVLRNLSEIAATRTISETFKKAINDLTVVDRGTISGARAHQDQSGATLCSQTARLRRGQKIIVQQGRRRQPFCAVHSQAFWTIAKMSYLL